MTNTAYNTANKEYKKISISFYGGKNLFSKKESPLQAREIFCCAASCDLRDEGKCICMRNSLHWLDADYKCPFGRTETHKGYTSRALKYYDFKDKYESDPAFQTQLERTGKYFFGRIEDCYVVCYDWAGLYKTDDGWATHQYKNPAVIPVNEFTVEMLYELLMFEGKFATNLKERNETHIPLFLKTLAKSDASVYEELLKQHPELADYTLDVLDKKAYLRTLADGSVVRLDGHAWTKQGNKIVCDDYHAKGIGEPVFGHGRVELEIDPVYVVKVANENWCNEDTEFAD